MDVGFFFCCFVFFPQLTFLSFLVCYQRPEASACWSQTKTGRTNLFYLPPLAFGTVTGSHCCYSSSSCPLVLQRKSSLSYTGALVSTRKDQFLHRREGLRKSELIRVLTQTDFRMKKSLFPQLRSALGKLCACSGSGGRQPSTDVLLLPAQIQSSTCKGKAQWHTR